MTTDQEIISYASGLGLPGVVVAAGIYTVRKIALWAMPLCEQAVRAYIARHEAMTVQNEELTRACIDIQRTNSDTLKAMEAKLPNVCRAAALVALCLLLTGCAPLLENHGLHVGSIARSLAIIGPVLAWLWLCYSSTRHLCEEVDGRLWRAFATYSGATWLLRLSDRAGLLLFGLPVWLLMLGSATAGLIYGDALGLGLLIGSRLGDFAFSHALPSLVFPKVINPGRESGLVLYPVEGLALLAWAQWSPELGLGLLVGTSIFFAIIPTLRISRVFA